MQVGRYLSISIFLYVLTSEGDIRRVPGNQVLGGGGSFLQWGGATSSYNISYSPPPKGR